VRGRSRPEPGERAPGRACRPISTAKRGWPGDVHDAARRRGGRLWPARQAEQVGLSPEAHRESRSSRSKPVEAACRWCCVTVGRCCWRRAARFAAPPPPTRCLSALHFLLARDQSGQSHRGAGFAISSSESIDRRVDGTRCHRCSDRRCRLLAGRMMLRVVVAERRGLG